MHKAVPFLKLSARLEDAIEVLVMTSRHRTTSGRRGDLDARGFVSTAVFGVVDVSLVHLSCSLVDVE